MFRNSREKLRVYRAQGLLKENIAKRHVEDRFLSFGSIVEADLYKEIEDYIKNYFIIEQRSSLGFVAGIYRRRLTSSLYSLVAQDSQVAPSPSVDSRYLLSKARSQDAAILVSLFEAAGLPDTLKIDYENTKDANRINIANTLATQRQRAQRLLDTFIT
jgi:hypothetical protein